MFVVSIHIWDKLLVVFTDYEQLYKLPDSCRVDIVTLLHKYNDRTDLKYWSPITLLNLDCELITKVLTLRMSSVLGEVIHPDQTCAIPGRKITDSLILIGD